MDPNLKKYATPREAEYLEAIERSGNAKAASRELGVSDSSVYRAMTALRRRAALSGYSPEHGLVEGVPDGFYLGRGYSRQTRDPDGNIIWLRASPDHERQHEMLLEHLCDRLENHKLPKIRQPKGRLKSDLMTLYPMGDPHIGMYSWAEETGEDVDCDITQRCLLGAADYLVDAAPDTEEGWILNLGDLFHADNMRSETERSGAKLDTDTRWGRVLDIGIDTMLRVVDRALQKHKRVHVRNVIGNHDDHTSVMLSKTMELFYRNNPRVTIHAQPNFFWYRSFGKVLIGSTHGDQTKPDQLPGIMAHDVPELWGDTLYRYWHTGHVHHDAKKEYPGCVWRSHRTLVGKDAYHARAGYRSGRSMSFFTYDAEYGEDEKRTFDVRRFRP